MGWFAGVRNESSPTGEPDLAFGVFVSRGVGSQLGTYPEIGDGLSLQRRRSCMGACGNTRNPFLGSR